MAVLAAGLPPDWEEFMITLRERYDAENPESLARQMLADFGSDQPAGACDESGFGIQENSLDIPGRFR